MRTVLIITLWQLLPWSQKKSSSSPLTNFQDWQIFYHHLLIFQQNEGENHSHYPLTCMMMQKWSSSLFYLLLWWGGGAGWGDRNHYHPLTHCNDDAKIFIITLWPIAMMGKSFSLPFDLNDDDENGYHSLTYCHDGEKPLSPFDLLHGWWENGYHHSLTHCHNREIVITLWPTAVMGKWLSLVSDLVQCNVLNLLQRSIWLGKYHWVV